MLLVPTLDRWRESRAERGLPLLWSLFFLPFPDATALEHRLLILRKAEAFLKVFACCRDIELFAGEDIHMDGAELRSFYQGLFGWKIQVDDKFDYGMVEATEGQGIPGGVGQLSDRPQPKVTFYVSTTSIDGSLQKAKGLGAEVLMPRTELPGGTILGMFRDPDGNAIGLVEEQP